MKSRLRRKILKSFSRKYGWTPERLGNEVPARRTDNRKILMRRLWAWIDSEYDYHLSRLY